MDVSTDFDKLNLENRSIVHANTILNELRKKGQLTDGIIKVDSQVFHIHMAVMSTCSPYFRALFTNNYFNGNRCEITIPGVKPETMSTIIEYAYLKTIAVNKDNAVYLLPAADQFLIEGIVKACCEFLCAELSPENCIGIYKFGSYYCHELEQTSLKYVMRNFTRVYQQSVEYLQLNFTEVCSLLSRDELNAKNEETVFEAILVWIDYNPDLRKGHIASLLRTVRLGRIDTQFFVEKIKQHPYVKQSDACKSIVIETLKYLYDLDIDKKRSVTQTATIARPRTPHDMVFVIGGWSGGNPTGLLEVYDTKADRWIVADWFDTGPVAYHGAASIGHLVYLIGGFDGTEYYSSVRCFNPSTSTMSLVAPMNAKRCYVSVAVLRGLIYAMGGYDGHTRQNTAERYNRRSNQWSLIPPMFHQRSDANATTHKGKVYICGGFNGNECLSTAECYDPVIDQWTLIPPMRNRRSGVGVIAYRDHIYALGGFNGVSRMNTAERYNPDTKTWQTVTEMVNPRSNFALEVIDDMIFAMGGFNGVSTIKHVECFDSSTEFWYEVSDLSINRSALSACVVTDLPNMNDYVSGETDRSGDGEGSVVAEDSDMSMLD